MSTQIKLAKFGTAPKYKKTHEIVGTVDLSLDDSLVLNGADGPEFVLVIGAEIGIGPNGREYEFAVMAPRDNMPEDCNVPCPQCQGTGDIVVSINKNGVDQDDMTLGCPSCDGSKSVGLGDYATWLRSQTICCECENPSGQTTSEPRGHSVDVLCNDCGKYVQFG